METAATIPKCHVSRLISRAMKINGTSRYGCFLAKNKTLFEEYLFSILENNTLEQIQGGSVAEGTHIKGSDADRMMVIPNITVHTSNKVGFTKGHSYLLDEVGSSPGYGRLRLLKLEETGHNIFDANIQDLLQETADGKYLSSEKFVSCFVSAMSSTKEAEYYREGPCAAAEQIGHMINKPDIKTVEDVAHALVCDDWPTGGQKWITRKRRHDWPTKDIIEKISKMKCHAVPVGNKRSNNFSLEWRISFLLGERVLVWNFNDTQVQCYVLLKQLIKKHIEPIAPDQLSSYHIKTVIFWMSEAQGMSVWCDENLIGCVKECLNKLSHCVEKQELQHYFYKENNLLYNKLENESDKERVLKKIDELQAHIEQCVSECLEGWDINLEMCKSCQTSHKNFKLLGNDMSCQPEKYEQIRKVHDIMKRYKTMFNIYVNTTLEYNRPSLVQKQLSSLERNPPEDVDRKIIETTKVFINIRLGMSYYGHISAPEEDELFQRWIEDTCMSMKHAYIKLEYGRQLDYLSGRLYLASIYLCQNKFSSSNDLVLSVLGQDKSLVYSSWCSSKRMIYLTKEGKTHLNSTVDLIGIEGKSFPAFDMIFSPDNVNCVPYPVKFECVLAQNDSDNVIMIHPCVYAYFLLCVGQFCDGQYESSANALEQLKQLVCELDGVHKYRALNLLGYCYTLKGNVKSALRCYSVSLGQTQRYLMVKNAAVYHICIILLKCLEQQRDIRVLYDRQKNDF